jgi:hypothetical protein
VNSRDNHIPRRTTESLRGELGALLRAVADNEATPDQVAALDAARAKLSDADHAALEATIDAERSLREATSRCMCASCPCAPSDLRARILAAVRQDERSPSGAPSSAPTPIPSGRSRDDHGPFLFRAFQRNWAFAAAAMIVLATVVGFLVLPTIAPNNHTWPPDEGARTQLVSFLGGEHGKCAPASRYADLKLSIRDRVRAEAFIAQWTPDAAQVLTAAGDDYRFLGAGPCGVPGAGDSVHMVFAPDDDSHATISVFLQDAAGREPQAMPRTLAQLGETAEGQVIRAFRHNDCLVYVVAPTDEDARRIAKNLGE